MLISERMRQRLITTEECQPRGNQKTVCNSGMCAGCMACIDICPKSAITIADCIDHMNALIDENRCIHCDLCHKVCQQNHPASLAPTMECWQGWATPEVRCGSSSGGFASAIMRRFVNIGGVVAACRFNNGDFLFSIADDVNQLEGFAGSKYVKSNPSGIYGKVRAELASGKDVLFIGMPCQISSMRNYIGMTKGERLLERLYTIDLICHGSPSIMVLKNALSEYGININQVSSIRFRKNNEYSLCVDEHPLVPRGCMDSYTTAFLHAACYTKNCYQCHYATRERVGDLSLGDSWGTELKDEEPKGISLALIQTEKGRELLHMSDLSLRSVDYENAVAHNHQLSAPSEMTKEVKAFFEIYKKTCSVKKATFVVFPKERLKQLAKTTLMHVGIIRK